MVKNFYSHTPCGVQHVPVMLIIMILNFYSHTPCGVQRCSFSNKYHIEYFYSHTPCGVQLQDVCEELYRQGFLLTHPSRGATLWGSPYMPCPVISTHTPLTGCNFQKTFFTVLQWISTHTPLTGCNSPQNFVFHFSFYFYSHTPHGVQPDFSSNEWVVRHFYSHTPHGVQLADSLWWLLFNNFYSHTPHGVQQCYFQIRSVNVAFLLTHPSRGATFAFLDILETSSISTHTPLTGCNMISRKNPK